MLRSSLHSAFALSMLWVGSAAAADRFFLYDMTTSTTFTGVYLAKSGSENWGGNQALNDKDHAVDPSERLTLNNLSHGVYDVKLIDRKGHVCIKHGVDLTRETSFEVHDSDLMDCK